MDRFYVIANKRKDPQGKTARRIQTYLEQKGKTCLFYEQGDEPETGCRYTDASRIPADTQCVLVVGGDGTILRAARDLIDRDLSLLGINGGTLGYLSEVDCDDIEPALDRLMEDRAVVERRMMIEGCVCRQGSKLSQDFALNDIVIARSGQLQVIDFNIYVNGAFLCSYSADGIIVSTPTGSTGYSLSAGGPIVSPDASLILLTPVSPHTLNNRSIILPADAQIIVKLTRARMEEQREVLSSFDGVSCRKLGVGDEMHIFRSERTTRLARVNKISFLEVLRQKMNGQ